MPFSYMSDKEQLEYERARTKRFETWRYWIHVSLGLILFCVALFMRYFGIGKETDAIQFWAFGWGILMSGIWWSRRELR